MEEYNDYALIGLGHLHYDFREYSEALNYWERMYENRKKHIDIRVLTSIGNCHRKLKTFAKGIRYFEKALELEPGNFYALFGLADCFRGTGEHEKSIQYWELILNKDPNNKVILTRAGDAYRIVGNYEKAFEYYNRALNIDYDVYAILGMALISKDKGHVEEAIESLEVLLKKESNKHRLFIETADCYLLLGNTTKAIETLENFQRGGIKNLTVSIMIEELKSGNY